MKMQVLKRPLMFAVLFSVCIAVICAFVNIYLLFAIAAGLLFSILLTIPLKSRFKEFLIISFSLAFVIAVSSICYYYFNYVPSHGYSEKTVDADCVVISCDDNKALLFCKSTKDGNKMNFFTNASFDKNEISLLPSMETELNITFYPEDKHGNNYGGVYLASVINECKVVEKVDEHSVLYLYHTCRSAVKSCFEVQDKEASAFLAGMMLGDEDEISGVFSNKLKMIGLSHVLSVSGLHLMLAVMFLDFLFAFSGLDYKKRSLISIIISFAFTVVSGFSISCIRSFVMLSVYYFARLTDKYHDSLTTLSVAAYLLLVFTPHNILDVSYILTTLATFGLIVFTPILNSLVPVVNLNRFISFVLRFIRNSITVSIAVNIMCIPVFVFMFKQVSVVSPLSNLLLTLPIQLLFYCGFALLFLGWIPFVHNLVGKCASWLYGLIESGVDGIYNVKNITVSDGNVFFYVVFVLLCVLVIGITIFNIRKNIKSVYPYILLYVLVCVSLFSLNLFLNHDKVSVNFVNVGHGNSTIITQDESAVVVDCGGDSFDGLSEVLRRRNIKRIELLALTHLDSDHTNFVSYLINNYEIDKIVYPEFCDLEKINELLSNVDSKTKISSIANDVCFNVLEDSKLYVYVEKALEYVIGKNTSALYKFVYGQTSVCLTGDMTISQENKYLDYGNKLDCDILLAAHHGSTTSSLKRILDIYTPDKTVISASEERKYNLPDDRIIKRLREYSEVLFTYDYSNIRFIIGRKGYKLTFE